MERVNSNPITIFGFAVDAWPKWAIMCVGAFGVFVPFLLQGMAQEALYEKTEFCETGFFTLVQFFGYFIPTFPYLLAVLRGKKRLHASIRFYGVTGMCLVSSMCMTNLSVDRLSYPTAVLFKSSKLIPVMIGGVIFLNKRYNVVEVLSVVLVVFGLIAISYSDKISHNRFDMAGVILASSSLCLDAVSSNLQEKALVVYEAPQVEVIAVMYGIGTVVTTTWTVVNGELFSGIAKCVKYPIIDFYLLAYATLGSTGVQCVYLLMKAFGSLVTVMVTSTRKAATVVVSFILFPTKRFTVYHLVSIFTIMSGLTLNYIGKESAGQKPQEPPSSHPIDTCEMDDSDSDNSVVDRRGRRETEN